MRGRGAKGGRFSGRSFGAGFLLGRLLRLDMWTLVIIAVFVGVWITQHAALIILAVLVVVGWKLARRVDAGTGEPWRPTWSLPGRGEPERKCFVYRVFDELGVFLYVGIAWDWRARFAQHAGDPDERHWWPRVDERRTIIDEYPNRAAAKAAESRWIKGLNGGPRPQHNRAENTWDNDKVML